MNTRATNFACDLTVLTKEQREQFSSVTDSLFAVVQETREQEYGLTFRFLNQPGQLAQIAEFIERESRCCPFLKFKLDVEPDFGPIWLHITGEAGTKEFLQAELDQIRILEEE